MDRAINRITLPKQLVEDAAFEGEIDDPDWEVTASELIGRWRWGTTHRVVLCSKRGPDWFAFIYQLSSGDSDWNTFRGEGDEVELYRVRPQNRTITEYVRVEDQPS